MTVRVLVVDDEPDVEALFRQQFRREVRKGLYALDFALSALAALAILDDAIGEKIILLVSDINMPGMSYHLHDRPAMNETCVTVRSPPAERSVSSWCD